MSIKNYARQDLILNNFLELPESINFPILTPSIKFCLNQLYPILGHYLIIDLNILQSYYPRSFDQNQSAQLEIQKNFFKNLKTVVPLHSNSSYWLVLFVYQCTFLSVTTRWRANVVFDWVLNHGDCFFEFVF